jgi:hypothetical protein
MSLDARRSLVPLFGLPMTRITAAALLGGVLLLASNASAATITFDELTPGVTLSSQYASQGVLFSPNAFSGSGSSSSGVDWATNTDMTIVSIDTGTLGVDYGALGTPSLVSGNILHLFSNWQYLEDGDPSFLMSLATPASAVSMTFAGLGGALASDTRMFVYSGSSLLGIVAASGAGNDVSQMILSFAAPAITRVAVAPGSFLDWVGVDNIVITPAAIPEPQTVWLLVLGLAGSWYLRRRRQHEEKRHA